MPGTDTNIVPRGADTATGHLTDHGGYGRQRWLERLCRAWLAVAIALLAGAPAGAAEPAADLQGGAAIGSGQASALARWLEEDEDDFLPVDEAFRLTTELGEDGAVLARWEMPDGYYLYRHRFAFDTRGLDGETSNVTLGEPEIPPGKRKVDEYFGEVEVYYHDAQARVPVASGSGPVEVGITYQGCADAGLCYPPETRWVSFNLSASADTGVSGGGPVSQLQQGPGAGGVPATEGQELASLLSSAGLLTSLGLFFVGGIALAFTPCVLPMVPILSSIIVGQAGDITRGRAFSLSLAYVLGMAATYAAVGTLVGLFGASLNLQAMLQAPAVLLSFALVFVLLSLSMFGFYELQLPQRWQNGLNALGNRVGGGKHVSVLVMGALSALVVSPCVSAPLAGALIYLSTTGDALLGGGALLALGLGMGMPLLLIGASGGHLLPRAGAWMNTVKAVFGVGLLAVAVWLLERVVPAGVTLALWAALAIGCGVYLGALDFAPRDGIRQLWKAGGAFSFIYGVLLLIGAASGGEDPLKPLSGLGIAGAATPAEQQHEEARWQAVANLDELRVELARAEDAGQMALLDLYADWCISCKVMERNVFPRPEVDSRLRQFHLLRADVTENDAQDRALMDAFGLFGPPSLVFFSSRGQELSDVRIQGEVGAERLAAHLQAVLDRDANQLAAR